VAFQAVMRSVLTERQPSANQVRAIAAARRVCEYNMGPVIVLHDRARGGVSSSAMWIQGPVLVATDLGEGADEALRQADALARAAKAPLHVCHVLPEVLSLDPLFPQLKLRDALDAPELEREAGEAVEERVEELTGRDGEDFVLELASGSAHAGIVQTADRIGAGLVVVGAHGRRKLPLGGTAERVVRHAHCHVLVARPAAGPTVLAANDASEPAQAALAVAAEEGTRRQAPLVVVHCMDLLLPGVVGYEVPPLGPEVIAAMRTQWQQRLEASLAQLAAQGEVRVEEGPAGPLIAKLAADLPAALVVVGTHGHTGWRRLVLGSVAEAVVRTAPASVLVVRAAQK
jgi:nucleotide-binding universal stress UspA family protein